MSRKADRRAATLALSMGIKLCPCGLAEQNCPKHKEMPTPEKSALYSYKVQDPKSGFFPGSILHQEWKREKVQELRDNPTQAEKALLGALNADSFLKGVFTFQALVFGFVPDFANEQLKMIIEVDGAVHNTTAGKRSDARRDNIFRRNGWIVKRFSNSQVINQTSNVLSVITACVHARLNGNKQR